MMVGIFFLFVSYLIKDFYFEKNMQLYIFYCLFILSQQFCFISLLVYNLEKDFLYVCEVFFLCFILFFILFINVKCFLYEFYIKKIVFYKENCILIGYYL